MRTTSGAEEMPIIFVTGNKRVTSYHHVAEILSSIYFQHYPGKMMLIADGGDNVHKYVQYFAEENGLTCEHCSNRQLRKELIHDRIIDECVVFWDDESQNLYHIARECKKKHIPLKIVNTF